MKATIVLFGCHKKLTNAHKLVSNKDQPEYYVRLCMTDLPLEAALGLRGMTGEILLNTIPAQPEPVC